MITGARSMEGVDVPWIVANMIGSASKEFPKTEHHALGDEIFRVEDVSLPSPLAATWSIICRFRFDQERSSVSMG